MPRSDAAVRADTFDAQLAAARSVLAERGIKGRHAAPPIHRALWVVGVRLPPPAFCSFALNASVFGAYFAVAWGGVMWVLMWSDARMPPAVALALAAGAGLVFGLGLAAHSRSLRGKHDLPTWESLARPAAPAD